MKTATSKTSTRSARGRRSASKTSRRKPYVERCDDGSVYIRQGGLQPKVAIHVDGDDIADLIADLAATQGVTIEQLLSMVEGEP